MDLALCRQLWIAACLDCSADPDWLVFEERYLRDRWIAAHELDSGHAAIESWNGLSAV